MTTTEEKIKAYAEPGVLVSTEWAEANLDSPGLRFVEIDVDTSAYETGHIPGAVGWNWQTDTQDAVVRDIPDPKSFAALAGRSGITPGTTLVLYGDNNNWFATYAFWLLKYYGHRDVRLIDGGRKKWLSEGRPVTTKIPLYEPVSYSVAGVKGDLRALRNDVFEQLEAGKSRLVDVRSPEEFSGELLAPPGVPQEGSQRGGHIPGAVNIGWGNAVGEDGAFKPLEQLQDLYGSRGVTGDEPIIAYCRIGERSSHTWFVLKYLLGYEDVRNYDGSWSEWGSLIGAPIEKGK